MLTYAPLSATSTQQEPNTKPWLLLLLCCFWLFPGIIGHDPWKPFEAQAADIVLNFTDQHAWLLPNVAETLSFERHPLFFWIATGLGRGLSRWLPLHDVVRLAAAFFTALSMWGVGMTGRELYNKRVGRYAVLAFIGSLGLVFWGHHASGHMLSMAAFAWLSYALVWGQRRPLPAGMILGVALLALFLGGVTSELGLALLLIISGFCCVRWRYGNMMVVLGSALVIAVPIGLFWLLALKQAHPDIYRQWLATSFIHGSIGYLHIPDALAYYLGLLSWFSWPALPMAIWSIWHNRRSWREKKWLTPILFFAVTFFYIVLLPKETNDYLALPILIPLALLAAGGIETQRRELAAALNWFGMMTFSLGALALWLVWSAIHLGFPSKLAARAIDFNAEYSATYSYPTLGFALFITVAWCWIVLRRRQLGKQALINWTCGLTLVWGLTMSLMLPWLDNGKTYRYVAQDLQSALAAHQMTNACIASQGLHSAVKASLDYFAGIRTQPESARASCPLLLVQTMGTDYFPRARAVLLWTGARHGETQERFYLVRQADN